MEQNFEAEGLMQRPQEKPWEDIYVQPKLTEEVKDNSLTRADESNKTRRVPSWKFLTDEKNIYDELTGACEAVEKKKHDIVSQPDAKRNLGAVISNEDEIKGEHDNTYVSGKVVTSMDTEDKPKEELPQKELCIWKVYKACANEQCREEHVSIKRRDAKFCAQCGGEEFKEFEFLASLDSYTRTNEKMREKRIEADRRKREDEEKAADLESKVEDVDVSSVEIVREGAGFLLDGVKTVGKGVYTALKFVPGTSLFMPTFARDYLKKAGASNEDNEDDIVLRLGIMSVSGAAPLLLTHGGFSVGDLPDSWESPFWYTVAATNAASLAYELGKYGKNKIVERVKEKKQKELEVIAQRDRKVKEYRRVYKPFNGRPTEQIPQILGENRVPISTAQFMRQRMEFSDLIPDLKNYLFVSDLIAYNSRRRGNDVKFILTVDKNRRATPNGRKALELINPYAELIGGAVLLSDELYDELEGIVVPGNQFGITNLFGIIKKELSEKETLESKAWRILARHPDEVPAKFAEDKYLLKEYLKWVKGKTKDYSNTGLYPDTNSDTAKLRGWCVLGLEYGADAGGVGELDDNVGRLLGYLCQEP